MGALIKVVTLGDSLTTGYIPSRIATQPYSRFLKELTDNFLKQIEKDGDVEVTFINRGVNGDLTSGMWLRFRHDVIQLHPEYVIILGGTNDIGWRIPIAEILGNLQNMFETARRNEIEPIACTIPSILGWDEGIPPRLRLNHFLKCYCHDHKIRCADIFAKTCDFTTNRLKSTLSSDGLHLNTIGYQKMADVIFEETLRNLLTHIGDTQG